MPSHSRCFPLLPLLILATAPVFADDRTPIPLTPEARDVVIAEMNQFLAGVQGIADALARDDVAAVADIARPLGAAAARGVPPAVAQQLPPGFRQLGGRVHGAFDVMAMDAADLGDADHALAQLAETLGGCVACHQTYRIETVAAKGGPDGRGAADRGGQ